MAEVVALIPARAGSKAVPNKNIRPLGGRPLLAWSIAACLQSSEIGRTIVSTDSADYSQTARKLGAEAPFLRPAEISGDSAIDYDFVVHALDWLAARGEEPAYIAHIRPTTPFRDPAVIDKGVRQFRAAADATALRSVQVMPQSAYKTFEIAQGGLLKCVGTDSMALDAANNARQQYPRTYKANGYVDVLSTAFIRQAGLIHGNHVIAFVTPPMVDVDSEEEFAYLEFQLAQNPAIGQKLFTEGAK